MKADLKKILFTTVAVPASSTAQTHGNQASYLIGGLIAVLILGYLVYTLLKPEKF